MFISASSNGLSVRATLPRGLKHVYIHQVAGSWQPVCPCRMSWCSPCRMFYPLGRPCLSFLLPQTRHHAPGKGHQSAAAVPAHLQGMPTHLYNSQPRPPVKAPCRWNGSSRPPQPSLADQEHGPIRGFVDWIGTLCIPAPLHRPVAKVSRRETGLHCHCFGTALEPENDARDIGGFGGYIILRGPVCAGPFCS